MAAEAYLYIGTMVLAIVFILYWFPNPLRSAIKTAGEGLLDKCPPPYKKVVGSRCRISRPKAPAGPHKFHPGWVKGKSYGLKKKKCTEGGYHCRDYGVKGGWTRVTCASGYSPSPKSGSGQRCLKNCAGVHKWAIPSEKNTDYCWIDATNQELAGINHAKDRWGARKSQEERDQLLSDFMVSRGHQA